MRSPESARRLLVALFALLLVQATGAPSAARAGPLPGPVPTPGRAGAPSTPPDAPAVRATVYGWPLRPDPPVEVAFREPTHRFGPGHRGVDLTAAPGAAVLAAAAGTVVFAGVLAGRGVVSVQHPDGLRTTYEPVTALVAKGTSVTAGTALGSVAPGHRSCRATCLHWGARRDRGSYVDPLLLLMPRHVRLLPVPGAPSARELLEARTQAGDEPGV